MADAIVLGHEITLDNIRNAKVKRAVIQAGQQCANCLQGKHIDHHTDYSERHSDHTQCGSMGD